MGFFFTLIYLAMAYITPEYFFGGQIAYQYHIMEIFAAPAILFSIFALDNSGITRMNQIYAGIGLAISISISDLLAGWYVGGFSQIMAFLPFFFSFLFIAINWRTKKQLQVLVALLFFLAVFVIVESQLTERSGGLKGDFFISMKGPGGELFYRIQGLGEINDPNDFAQFLLSVLPVMFIFWIKGKAFLNLIRVYIPVLILLYGLFLSHSRGAMLAVALMVIVACRRKLGLIPSAITGGVVIVGLYAAGFTGGRDVSAANGEDRMAAWAAGLGMIKSHPIFGVGFTFFTHYWKITAHNTIVVLGAEIGVIGLFFWLCFVISTIRDLWVVSEYGRESKKDKKADSPAGLARFRPSPASTESLAGFAFPGRKFAMDGPDPTLQRKAMLAPSTAMPLAHTGSAPSYDPNRFAKPQPGTLPMEEIRRIATLVILSFVGQLAAGWFLSRALAFSIFIFAGVSAVLFRMARQNGMEVSYLPLSRALKITILPTIVLVAIVWIILRFNNAFGR